MLMKANRKLHIYLSGPDAYFEDAFKVASDKCALCDRHGFIGLTPLDSEVDSNSPQNLPLEIYKNNLQLMENADLIIANITPFRGSGMDQGTAFEVGYFAALEKPILLYSNDHRDYKKRVNPNQKTDDNGHHIEDFGDAESLMIIQASWTDVFHDPIDEEEKFSSLKNFESALKFLSQEERHIRDWLDRS